MLKLSLLTSCLFIASPAALALNVGDITSFMQSDTTKLSKEIKNNTNDGRLVNINIERLSSPLDSGTVIAMGRKDELLSSPANLVLPGQSSNIVQFYYNGPKDNQERYYRITWSDQALSAAETNPVKRHAIATTSVRIGTILVVSPRNEKFAYHATYNNVKNIGNVTFKAIAYGKCVDKSKGRDCKENYFIMPGKERKFTQVDMNSKESKIAIWHGDKFISVK
jgi:hypothetical protein